jgi:hypothetical protein
VANEKDSLEGGSIMRVMTTICCLVMLNTASASWDRHTIDSESRGADGVRLADVNGDGWLDIVTGWEEGGQIRLCLHPGVDKVASRWPAVTVGKVDSPEDALPFDVDGDGAMDVVSCCEGSTRTIYVHWGPQDPGRQLDPAAWKTEAFPATQDQQMWMFAAAMNVDDQHGLDLVVGAKGTAATVGWLQAPENPRQLDQWQYRPIRDAGWIMSLIPLDADGDGDRDVLLSDRRGAARGVYWLENPGADRVGHAATWESHLLGGDDHEVMFVTLCDLDGDDQDDVLAATFNSEMLLMRRPRGTVWSQLAIRNPYQIPYGKAVAVGDLDLDGQPDIVHTAETRGRRLLPGVSWMSSESGNASGPWKDHDVSRDVGSKFDLVELVDVDNDGDLDIITCEEQDNLGVVWYENPVK